MLDAQTVRDVFGCLRGVAGFGLVMVPPGYLVGRLSGIGRWRQCSSAERLLWSVGLGFVVVPLSVVYLVKYLGWGWAFGAAAVCWTWAGWLILSGRRRVKTGRDVARSRRRFFVRGWWLGAVGWMVFAILELLDIGTAGHLYLSVTVFDHALRAAFVDAAMRTGAPPANPLFWAGHPAPMRYYYFWYVVTASVAKLMGTTAWQALLASVVWAGFGLAAAIGLYTRWFLAQVPAVRARTRLIVALGLLAVAGLDILPAVAKMLAGLAADPDVDWWAPDQVTTWLGSLLWVPHHVAALVCCVAGFLLVWMCRDERRGRTFVAVLAGIGFASAFGLSTWVALAFALSLAGWAVWAWFRERGLRGAVKTLASAGVVASVLLLPYLRELQAEASGVVTMAGGGADAQASPGRLMRFGVRRMIDAEPIRELPGFSSVAETHPRVEEALAALVLLVPGYFAELGFWGAVLFAALRAKRLDEAGRTARALVLAGLFVTTFLRSTIVTNNDFGMRSALVMQFFLLLLGVRWVEGAFPAARRGWRRFAWAMLWIGVAGTGYEAVLLRVYLPVEERSGNPEMAGLSERAAALRAGMLALNGTADRDAVVQFNTEQPSDYFRYAQILLANHQIGSALPVCTVGFGGDARDCRRVAEGTGALFAVRRGGSAVEGVMSAAEARRVCAGLGLNALVATRWDAVWGDRDGWVWNLPKVVDTGDVRVVNCGL